MPLGSVDIVSVPVSDQDRAKAFYREAFGFTVVADEQMGPGMRWVQLMPPGGGPAITLTTWFDSMPAGSQRGLVISCTDLEAVRDQLAASDVEVSDGIQSAPWADFFEVFDPDGNGWVVQDATRA